MKESGEEKRCRGEKGRGQDKKRGVDERRKGTWTREEKGRGREKKRGGER